MLKRAASVFLCLILLIGLAVPAWAEETADSEPLTVYVDNEPVEAAGAIRLNKSVYASLCMTAAALRPDINSTWDEYGRMVISSDDITLSARPGDCYVVANGRYLYIPSGVKQDEHGDVMVPATLTARIFNASAAQNENGDILISSGDGVIASGEEYYNSEEVELLARVINNECGDGSLLGQIAVGDVILNRVGHPSFPDSVAEVIYQPGQFPGATKTEPDSESILAAKLCLDGASVIGDACWFSRAGRACWASRNKTMITTLGGNAYYA